MQFVEKEIADELYKFSTSLWAAVQFIIVYRNYDGLQKILNP